MLKQATIAVGVTFLLSASAVGQGGEEGGISLSARRFYREGVGTTVHGVCRVPFGLLEPVRGGSDGFAAYRVSLVVRDTSGLALTEQTWDQRVPNTMLEVSSASSAEQFRFALAAGRYTVEATVTDSASGRVIREQIDLEAFGDRPLASDLILSTGIRQASDSGQAASGELALGGFLVTAQTEPVLTPTQSQLFYYVEVYPGRAADISVRARVRRADGEAVIASEPETVSVAEAGVATSGLELAGLPPGEYRLELDLAFPDTTLVRGAPFRMASFETEAAIARAVGAQSTDVFGRFLETQLDSLYRPLVYIQEGGERGVYDGLSVEAKRNYLRQFWQRRDPTPATPQNEAREDYYRQIAHANREFREGGAGDVPGWRTDRGRIFIRYGEADETLRRPAAGPTQPYEVWKYTRGRPRKFVFLDQTGLGHYVLIYTDERREPSYANWEQLLGPEAVLDVQRF